MRSLSLSSLNNNNNRMSSKVGKTLWNAQSSIMMIVIITKLHCVRMSGQNKIWVESQLCFARLHFRWFVFRLFWLAHTHSFRVSVYFFFMAVTKDERRRGQDNKRFLLRVHNVLSCNYLLHYFFCKVELVEECNDL